jgi:hypothetical protein
MHGPNSGPDAGPDAGAGSDAGAGGGRDAGSADAGASHHAGSGGHAGGGSDAGGRDAGGGHDAGAGTDAGSGDSGSVAGSGTGFVRVTQTVYGSAPMAVQTFSTNAFFGPDSTAVNCHKRKSGPCTVSTCMRSDAGMPGGTPPSAGDITISGGMQPITMTTNANGIYNGHNYNMALLFNAGDQLTFAAAGNPASIPAFHGRVTAPAAVQVTTVEGTAWPDPHTAIQITLSQGFTTEWSGANGGDVIIGLSANAGVVSATCSFAASSNMGKVPASALTDFPAGFGTLVVNSSATVSVTAGSYSVDLELEQNATLSGGSMAGGQVTLQ